MAIRYRYVDRYVSPGEKVVPPRLESVRPMLDFIEKFWIDPYLEIENGEVFFRGHVPAEIVFLGGLIYNENGTVTLGTADAGAQITFTNVNAIDPTDPDWRDLQLQTVYHEFAHTVHQRYKLPTAFETIAPAGYSSAGSWFNILDEEAVERGFVSPYATSSPNEDFAETVSFYLFDIDFNEKFIAIENCSTGDCEGANAGRILIAAKLAAIRDHYKKVTGINLDELRAVILEKL
jgi:substrate import-associated zinc metallohydrolase lipoprotein